MHICPQEAYSWPFATLRRFEIFLKQEQALRGFDYIFFSTPTRSLCSLSRGKCCCPGPKGERLLVVQHPSFYAKPNYEFTYDRNPRSTACIPYGLGKILRLAAASTAARPRRFWAVPHAGQAHSPGLAA